MIPKFPQFKLLELSDKNEIELITRQFMPYSDFNFVSLWGWNVSENAEVSIINGNLVLKYFDYLTQKPLYSFIGKNDVRKCLKDVLEFLRNNNLSDEMKLVPEEVIDEIADGDWDVMISEDEGSHDYVLSVQSLKMMSGKKLKPKRNFLNRFHKYYEGKVVVRDMKLSDAEVQREYLSLFESWKLSNPDNDARYEYIALQRLFDMAGQFELLVFGVYIDERLVGFSINEITHLNYGMIHYEKADASCVGIYPFMKQELARRCAERGVEYINYQQDIGMEGLRKAKLSYNPVRMLRKYNLCFEKVNESSRKHRSLRNGKEKFDIKVDQLLKTK